MTTSLKARGSSLIRIPPAVSDSLAIGCPGSGTCCDWPPPTPTTMDILVAGFQSPGVQTCVRTFGQCSGHISEVGDYEYGVINGSYSTTDLIILNPSEITGIFTFTDDTYANPGILVASLDTYGEQPSCDSHSKRWESYLTSISATIRCTDTNYGGSNCPVPVCGRYIYSATFLFSCWEIPDVGSPFQGPLDGTCFPGVPFDIPVFFTLFTTCGNTFIPSTTNKVEDVTSDHWAINACGIGGAPDRFITILSSLDLTVTVS